MKRTLHDFLEKREKKRAEKRGLVEPEFDTDGTLKLAAQIEEDDVVSTASEEEQEEFYDATGTADYRHILLAPPSKTPNVSKTAAEVEAQKAMRYRSLAPKETAPDGSARQQRLIDDALDAMAAVLQEPLAVKMKIAIEADWDAKQQLAVVRAFRGNINAQMGRHVHGKAYLLPEEVWHLLMRGTLVLYLDQLPLHPQDALPLVLDLRQPGVWQRQMIFDHLRRLGYVVARHGLGFRQLPGEAVQDPSASTKSLWLTPSSENPSLQSPPYNAFADRYKELQRVFLPDENENPGEVESRSDDDILPDFDVYRFRSGFKKTDPGDPDFHVFVSSQQQAMPSMRQLDSLRRRFKMIYVGLVDVGSISFYKLW